MELLSTLIEKSKLTDPFVKPSEWFNNHGVNILIIIAAAWLASTLGVMLISRFLHTTYSRRSFATESDRKKRLATLDRLIATVVKIIAWITALSAIISEIGFNTAPLLASAGVVGVALGIGAQSLIKDFVNGMFIIIENQYRVGDVVTLEASAPVSGTVQAITVRTTILKDLDGNVHHIPNGSITIATNKTFDVGKINEVLVVDSETDTEKLEKIVNKVGDSLMTDEAIAKNIRKAPHFDQIIGFNERGLAVRIIGETVAGKQWSVRSELYKRLRKELVANKIDISFTPFAQTNSKKSSR